MHRHDSELSHEAFHSLRHDYRSVILNLKSILTNAQAGDLDFGSCLEEIRTLIATADGEYQEG